jgi:hypothetical protein
VGGWTGSYMDINGMEEKRDRCRLERKDKLINRWVKVRWIN